MKQRYLFGVIAIGPLMAASCSVALDFGGLTDGKRAEAGTDAPLTADASDAPPPRDTSASPDVGADAGADAPTPPYCASLNPKPLFCDDFDTVPLSASWDEIGATGGTPDQSSTAFTSPPSALRIRTNALVSGANLYVAARKFFAQFAGKPVHVRFAFDLRIDQIDVAHGSDGLVAAVVFSTGNDYYEWQISGVSSNGSVRLTFAEAGTTPDGGSVYDGRDLSTPLPLGKWKRVVVDVVVNDLASPAGVNTAKVFFDGALEVQKPLLFPVMNAPPRLELGTSYIRAPSDPWTFYVDNATIDITPP